jgi:putative DNA primase/helicase
MNTTQNSNGSGLNGDGGRKTLQLLRTEDERKAKEKAEIKAARLISHNKLLDKLLSEIPKVDFRILAEKDDPEDKIKSYEYQVLVVEQVLCAAKQKNWSMANANGKVYLFNSEFWSDFDDKELEVFLGKAAEKLGISKLTARHHEFRKSLVKQFDTLANLPKPEQDNDDVLINLKNGTLHINSDGVRLLEFNETDFLTYQLPFNYNPQATAPIFKKYIERVLPDKSSREVLFEFLGYIFIKASFLKLEKALLLYGSGANGKSVLFEVLNETLGRENTANFSLQSLTNDNGYFRAMLANKLVNYGTEINGKLETSFFKQLVSGEPIEARLPYKEPFTIRDYAKLIFNANELPKSVEQTEAYFRRFLIIPFEVTIPYDEQDPELAKKIIQTERPGVLNLIIEGLNRLLEQKRFSRCDKAEKALHTYRKESDSVAMFIDENDYKPGVEKTDFMASATLYESYKRFCTDNGYGTGSMKTFTTRMKALGFENGRNISNTARGFFIKAPI